MGTIISLLFIGIYIFMAWTFTRNSIQRVWEYFSLERSPGEIVEGRVLAFEEQRVGRARGHGKVTVFYPVFSYRWGGETYRNYGRRLPATVNRELQLIPRTKLEVGDAVPVRVFTEKPEQGRMEEKGYFWRSRIPGHMLTALVGMVMMAFGVYWAIGLFLP